jgi:hypothetical protein
MGKRAEMRREKHKKETTYSLTASQIQQIREEAIQESMTTAFKLMLGLPTMVIHDKFGYLMKKEKREETFLNWLLNYYDGYCRGFFTLEDIDKILKDEGGIAEIKEKRKMR